MENIMLIEGIIGVSIFGIVLGIGLLMVMHDYLKGKRNAKMLEAIKTEIVPEWEMSVKRIMKEIMKITGKEMNKMMKDAIKIQNGDYDD